MTTYTASPFPIAGDNTTEQGGANQPVADEEDTGGGKAPAAPNQGSGTGFVPISSVTIESVTFVSDHNILNDYDKNWDDNTDPHIRPEWTPSANHSVSHTIDKQVILQVKLKVEPANASSQKLTFIGKAPYNLVFKATKDKALDTFDLTSDVKLPKEITDFTFKVDWSAERTDPNPKPHQVSVNVLNSTTSNWMFLTFGIPGIPKRPMDAAGKPLDPDSPPRQGITRIRMIAATRVASKTEIAKHKKAPVEPLNPHHIAEGIVGAFSVNPNNNYPNEWRLGDPATIAAACYSIVRFTEAVMAMINCPGTRRLRVVWAWVKNPTVAVENDAPFPNMNWVGYKQPRLQDYKTYGSPPDVKRNAWKAGLEAGGEANNYEACLEVTNNNQKMLYAPGFGPCADKQKVLLSFHSMSWFDEHDTDTGVIIKQYKP
jgi:hypothetical protein